MNLLVGFLLLSLLGLTWINIRLRSDLCQARWLIYELTYLYLFQNKTVLNCWVAPDPQVMIAYLEGQISLEALLRHLQQKHSW